MGNIHSTPDPEQGTSDRAPPATKRRKSDVLLPGNRLQFNCGQLTLIFAFPVALRLAAISVEAGPSSTSEPFPVTCTLAAAA